MSSWNQMLSSGIVPLPSASTQNNFLRANSTGTGFEFTSIEAVRDEINLKAERTTPSLSTTEALALNLSALGVHPNPAGENTGFFVEVLITVYANHDYSKTYHYVLQAYRKVAFVVVFDDSNEACFFPVAPAAGDFVTEDRGIWINKINSTTGKIELDELPTTVKFEDGKVLVTVGNALGSGASGIDPSVPIPLYFVYEVKIIENHFPKTTT